MIPPQANRVDHLIAISTPVFLFKVNLIPDKFYNHITYPHYSLYIGYHECQIKHFIKINHYWNASFYNLNEALSIFNKMYPRWFTLYHYFKCHHDIPMDIFTNILKYYTFINKC